MNRSTRPIWSLLLALSALWLLADTLLPAPFTYFSFRAAFVQYTGTIGMGLMSAAMLLAARPRWLVRPLGGLGPLYRLHKWLGIVGMGFAILHWWWAQGTKWMVGWGWLSRPARRPPSEATLSWFEQWLRSQRGPAESLGEWAFYAAVVLIVLALVKPVASRLFRHTHRWLAVVYLVLVYHSLLLVKPGYWSQPVGWITLVLLFCGTGSAVLLLAGRTGRRPVGIQKAPASQSVAGAVERAETRY